MDRKFLDYDGLLHLWAKLKGYFVKAEKGKGLSTNDYTNDEKTKLDSLHNYNLPEASIETLGGVKVGSGLTVAEGGVLSTKAVGWTDVQDKPATFPSDAHNHTANQVTGLHAVATSGLYSDLTGAPKIPTDNNELDNGAGYQTAKDVEDIIEKKDYQTSDEVNATIAAKQYQTAADVEGIINAAIEAKEYQTAAQVDLLITQKNYQTAADVATAVANAHHLKRSIVSELPDVGGANEDTIYMVLLPDVDGDNRYTEWMVVDGKWEKTGDSTVDLKGYLKDEDFVSITNEEIEAIVKT